MTQKELKAKGINLLKKNIGLCHTRRMAVEPADGMPNRERAFAETWNKRNQKRTGTGRGMEYGMLQGLFVINAPSREEAKVGYWEDREMGGGGETFAIEVSEREQRIVATFVQFLGTSGGLSFLDDALKRCGYKIVSKDD